MKSQSKLGTINNVPKACLMRC